MAGYTNHGSSSNSNNNTIAEREAELVALQSAFDEYIASSRELEEELDAELAKMRTCVCVIVVVLWCDFIWHVMRHFGIISISNVF
jgi:hypothetical protein